jgi:hypothetical protein
MDGITAFLVQQPLHILGVALVLGMMWAAITPRVPSMRMAALAWLGYAFWEWIVLLQTPDANIRMDLLLLWPLLAILTLWALIRLFYRRKSRE